MVLLDTRRGGAVALATTNGVGGGGHARPWGEEAEERGGERTKERVRERIEEPRRVSRRLNGGGEEAGGGSRRWPRLGCARATRNASRREEDDARRGRLGLTGQLL